MGVRTKYEFIKLNYGWLKKSKAGKIGWSSSLAPRKCRQIGLGNIQHKFAYIGDQMNTVEIDMEMDG